MHLKGLPFFFNAGNLYHSLEYEQYELLQQCDIDGGRRLLARMSHATLQAMDRLPLHATGTSLGDASLLPEKEYASLMGGATFNATTYKQWELRMWARQVLFSLSLDFLMPYFRDADIDNAGVGNGADGADDDGGGAKASWLARSSVTARGAVDWRAANGAPRPLPMSWSGATVYSHDFYSPQSEAGAWNALALAALANAADVASAAAMAAAEASELKVAAKKKKKTHKKKTGGGNSMPLAASLVGSLADSPSPASMDGDGNCGGTWATFGLAEEEEKEEEKEKEKQKKSGNWWQQIGSGPDARHHHGKGDDHKKDEEPPAAAAVELADGCISDTALVGAKRITDAEDFYSSSGVAFEAANTRALKLQLTAVQKLLQGDVEGALADSEAASEAENAAVTDLLLPTSTTLFFLPSDAVDGMVAGWAAAAAPASSPEQLPYLQRSQTSFERCLEPLIRPNHTVCLLGLARVSAALQDRPTAKFAYSRLLDIWGRGVDDSGAAFLTNPCSPGIAEATAYILAPSEERSMSPITKAFYLLLMAVVFAMCCVSAGALTSLTPCRKQCGITDAASKELTAPPAAATKAQAPKSATGCCLPEEKVPPAAVAAAVSPSFEEESGSLLRDMERGSDADEL